MEKISFLSYVDNFPEVSLPIILGEKSHLHFSKKNKQFSQQMIEQFILQHEFNIDQYTEFIPCFSIKSNDQMVILVYWKASLLNYQFVLNVYNIKGVHIDSAIIDETISNGKHIIKSVATFNEDFIINIASGQIKPNNKAFDLEQKKFYCLEILPDGTIMRTNLNN